MNWLAHSFMAAFLPALLIVATLTGCCTHKCNDMPKWRGYSLEYRP